MKHCDFVIIINNKQHGHTDKQSQTINNKSFILWLFSVHLDCDYYYYYYGHLHHYLKGEVYNNGQPKTKTAVETATINNNQHTFRKWTSGIGSSIQNSTRNALN